MFRRFYAATLGALLATGAQATTIEWTFTNAHFEDDAAVVGSFFYDTDSSVITSFDFDTGAGDLPGYAYDSTLGASANIDTAADFIDFNRTSGERLRIYVETDDLATAVANLGFGSSSGGFDECGITCSDFRIATGGGFLAGSVVSEPDPGGAVIPLPASVWLLGFGVAGLGLLRRLQKPVS